MGVDGVSFNEYVEQQYKGIPDRTSTIEDKKKAIEAKKNIMAHKDCPPATKRELLKEIAQIEDEIATMEEEKHDQAMNSSVFPPRNDLG